MAGMTMFSREVAKRVFAEELKSSNYSFRDGAEQNQYAPSYLLTPTGAKCNRVLMIGTLTEKDDIGGDTEYWRGRLVDPTGSIHIYAGQYQPEAAQILSGMETPSFVAVVGKPNLYQTEDGNIIISLRAEAIQKVDEEMRNHWVMDTARRTLERLKLLKGVRPEPDSGGFATADSVPAPQTTSPEEDSRRAAMHYHTDLDSFRQMLLRALVSFRADLEGAGSKSQARASVSASVSSPVSAPVSVPVASEPIVAAPEERRDAPAPKKGRPRKSESLAAWPEEGGEEEVETINLGKKS